MYYYSAAEWVATGLRRIFHSIDYTSIEKGASEKSWEFWMFFHLHICQIYIYENPENPIWNIAYESRSIFSFGVHSIQSLNSHLKLNDLGWYPFCSQDIPQLLYLPPQLVMQIGVLCPDNSRCRDIVVALRSLYCAVRQQEYSWNDNGNGICSGWWVVGGGAWVAPTLRCVRVSLVSWCHCRRVSVYVCVWVGPLNTPVNLY